MMAQHTVKPILEDGISIFGAITSKLEYCIFIFFNLAFIFPPFFSVSCLCDAVIPFEIRTEPYCCSCKHLGWVGT